MSLEQLVLQTQERVPEYHRSRVEIEPLAKGGSERKFYRICAGNESPVILVKYPSQKEENRRYVEIAKFLTASGVKVPAIYFHDATEGLIWMQDLGDEDLWAWRAFPWAQRPSRIALQVSKLHIFATQSLPAPAFGSSVSSASNSISGSSSIFRQLLAFSLRSGGVGSPPVRGPSGDARDCGAAGFPATRVLVIATSSRRTSSSATRKPVDRLPGHAARPAAIRHCLSSLRPYVDSWESANIAGVLQDGGASRRLEIAPTSMSISFCALTSCRRWAHTAFSTPEGPP